MAYSRQDDLAYEFSRMVNQENFFSQEAQVRAALRGERISVTEWVFRTPTIPAPAIPPAKPQPKHGKSLHASQLERVRELEFD